MLLSLRIEQNNVRGRLRRFSSLLWMRDNCNACISRMLMHESLENVAGDMAFDEIASNLSNVTAMKIAGRA